MADPKQPAHQPSEATVRMAAILGVKWVRKPTWWAAVIPSGSGVTVCGGPGEMPEHISKAMLAEKDRRDAE